VKPLDRHHPGDDRLIALYFGDEATADEQGNALRQHLLGCETCTWRYTELTAPLQRLRHDAASEADEVFTPARLDAQRDSILARLDHEAASPRVIPFPASTARLDRMGVHRPVARWIAAAAAAGLLLGVAAGRFLNTGPVPSWTVAEVAATRPPVPTTARVSPQADNAAVISETGDEAFLTAVDLALTRHRISALSVIDDLTPHVREAVMARR
jgi:hypothetical protein